MKITLDKLLELDRRVSEIHNMLMNTSYKLVIRRYRIERCQNIFMAAKKRFSDNMLGIYSGLMLVSINTTDNESALYINGLIERYIT